MKSEKTFIGLHKKIKKNYSSYFTKKFNILLERWQKNGGGKKRTLEEFGKAAGVTRIAVSNWKKGTFPDNFDNFYSICTALGVTPNEFIPETFLDNYEYSTKYATHLVSGREVYAHDIGLKNSFLAFLKDMEDFSDIFPAWAPIRKKDWEEEGDYLVRTSTPQNTAIPDDENTLYQYVLDETRITFSNEDLRFLNDTQEKIKEYIRFLFYERTKEMQTELDIANDCIKQVNEGKLSKFSTGDLEEIDRYTEGYYKELPQRCFCGPDYLKPLPGGGFKIGEDN